MISGKFIWQTHGEISAHQMIFKSQNKKDLWEMNLQNLEQLFKNSEDNLLHGPKQDVN